MSGVFTLGQVRIRQGKDTWSTASDVWMIGSPGTVGESPFGFFAGGKVYNPTKIGSLVQATNRHILKMDCLKSVIYSITEKRQKVV